MSVACATVSFFRDHKSGDWRVEGVRVIGSSEPELAPALVLPASFCGIEAHVQRAPTPAGGWLARTYASFPEQLIGQWFAVRGMHLGNVGSQRRIALNINAGLAFGSGEHGSTRGCLRALERVAWRRPRRILDLGAGSGILVMATARLLHQRVLATDVEPWAVRAAQQNAALNRLGHLTRFRLADGWRHRAIRQNGPFDLVFANILARPLV